MSLTLAKVLDPKSLARADYNLPAMLKRLIRQKQRELEALQDEKMRTKQYAKTAKDEALKKELNNLRARSDLLYQLNLVDEDEALELLETEGDPTKLSWRPRQMSDVEELQEALKFAKMQKEVERRRQAAPAKVSEVYSVAIEDSEGDEGDSDDEMDDDDADEIDLGDSDTDDEADFIKPKAAKPKIPKAAKPTNPKAAKAKSTKSAAAVLQPLRDMIKTRVIPDLLAVADKTLKEGELTKVQSKRLLKEAQTKVQTLLRLDAMMDRVIKAPEKVTNKQWTTLQITLKKVHDTTFKGTKMDAARKWVDEQKSAKKDTKKTLPASVGVASTEQEKKFVKRLQKAGATTKQGTCPLGPPPEGKKCVRGFWKAPPKGRGKKD